MNIFFFSPLSVPFDYQQLFHCFQMKVTNDKWGVFFDKSIYYNVYILVFSVVKIGDTQLYYALIEAPFHETGIFYKVVKRMICN